MLSYKITFTPGRYYIAPAGTATVPYFNILDERTRQPVAFAFTENIEQTVCFSLALVNAMVEGDATKTRELTRLIDDLKKQDG